MIPSVSRSRLGETLAFLGCGLILVLGTFWAFQRGANDFSVFYEAGRLVNVGRALELYRSTPDRFLYAPVFAWWVAPLGLLPRSWALGVWCLAKSAVLLWVVLACGRRVESAWGRTAAALALLLVARPVLIDFQYGQVNILVFGACMAAVLSWTSSVHSPWRDGFAALALGIASISKLFPLALVCVPWFLRERGRWARVGVLAAFALAVLLPVISLGPQGALLLHGEWYQALLARGFPLESHNQSFAAFLRHAFSGEMTPIIALSAPRSVFLGAALGPEVLRGLSLFWSLGVAALGLGWLLSKRLRERYPLRWSLVAATWVILPSHLVWKPYFIFAFPVAFAVASDFFNCRNWLKLAVLVICGFLMNLTGFDFVGPDWAARFEALASMLFAHLALLGFAVVPMLRRRSRNTIASGPGAQ